MKIAHYCGYYSDFGVKMTGVARPGNPPFWEAYMFCWAVKSGQYHRDFYTERPEGRLTEHATAMARAGSAAQRLDEYMSSVRGTGVLREFNRAYKRRRMAASANGHGFMTFKTAMTRLQTALIPLLTGDKPVATASLFAEVFGR
jgi:hypothetical protein